MSIKRRLGELTRKELENFLVETLSIMVKMSHQLRQFKQYVDSKKG